MRRGACFAALLAVSLVLGVAGANAAKSPIFDFGPAGSLGGQFATSRGIAINTSGNGGVPAGTIYVVDFNNNRIQSLDPNGNFIRTWGYDVDTGGGTGFEICEVAANCKAGVAGGAGGQFNGIAGGIAVDQNTGNLVLVDRTNNRVQQFDATGHFIRTWGADVDTGGGTGFEICEVAANCKAGVAGAGAGMFSANSAIVGVGTDSTGNVYVADAGNRRVQKFSPSGAFLAMAGWNVDAANPSTEYEVCTVAANCQIGAAGTGVGQFATGTPSFLATSAAGDVYVVDATNSKIVHLSSSLAILDAAFAPAVVAGGSSLRAIAVNPADGHVFFARSTDSSIYEVNPATQTVVATHAAGSPNWTGMAINPTNGRLYASGNAVLPSGSWLRALEEGLFTPNLTIAPPSPVSGTKATLKGTVNPNEASLEQCFFEYGKTNVYGKTVPCAETPAEIGSGTSPVSVHANVSGLAPNATTYNYRLVVVTPKMQVASPNQSFQTATTVVTEPASSVLGSRATANGTVNPDGVEVTECKFEYGLTTSYGASKPCEGAIPTDTSSHSLSASLNPLLANSTTYHFRIFVKNAEGAEAFGVDRTLTTATTFITNAATEVTDVKATFNATVKLEGVAFSDCRFEYGLTSLYGASIPCAPPVGMIPNNFENQSVSANLSSLAPGATYHFRIAATNGAGTVLGADKSFSTLGPPLIAAQYAMPTGGASAALGGYVNPRGFATSYYFEWGPDASYGHRVPSDFDPFLGSGTSPVKVSASLSELDPNVTYHFRIVASSDLGIARGPDQTFTTPVDPASCANAGLRTRQTSESNPDGTTYLPSCMALELVTPPRKFNQKAEKPVFSASDKAIRFRSIALLADAPTVKELNGDAFIAIRGDSGWTSHTTFGQQSSLWEEACSFSSTFSRWTLLPSGSAGLGSRQPYSGGIDGVFSPLGPVLTPNGLGVITYCGGGSADASHVFFAASHSGFLSSASDVGEGEISPNQYVAYVDDQGTPTVELLTQDAGGAVYGGSCGAQIGGRGEFGAGIRRATRGAISPDGSRVYFTTRPSQGAGACNTTLNKKRVMKRVQTPSGPQITTVSASECSRVSPPCSSTDGDDLFMGASLEGNRVFFESTRQLTNSDLDSGTRCELSEGAGGVGCDLYLYDGSRPPGARLTQVSAGDETDPTPGQGAEVLGVADISGDGSHVYFVAKGVLTTGQNASGRIAELGKPNLYVYERDAAHPGGRTTFIATLDPGQTWSSGAGRNEARAVPLFGSDPEDLSVGGDGHILVFKTKAALVAGDTDGGRADLYRYDADTGVLIQVSVAAPGGSDNGPFGVSANNASAEAEAFGSFDSLPPPRDLFDRWSSEDGRVISFSTKEALDPKDTDGAETTYVWDDGTLTALPRSLPVRGQSISPSGSVVFVTGAQLLPEDGDNALDVYLAKPGGGYKIPDPPKVCEGEACQGAVSARPEDPKTASESFVGPGNLTSTPPSCKKGSVARQGKCAKKKRNKRHHRGKRTRDNNREASTHRRAGK